MESKDALVAILAAIAMLSSVAGIVGSIAAAYFSHKAKSEAAAAKLAMIRARREATEKNDRLENLAIETHKIVNSQRDVMIAEILQLKNEITRLMQAQKVPPPPPTDLKES